VTPSSLPDDGLAPDAFFTYHIVFVPDLSQKFGLKVRGGPGEVRAAMNLVNGWQFTGLGPFYAKDSATAQNVLASGTTAKLTGQGVADVVHSMADLAGVPGLLGQPRPSDIFADDPRVQKLSRSITALPLGLQPMTLPRYAEIHVFEPRLGCDGQMTWVEIANLAFDRQILGLTSAQTEDTSTAGTSTTPTVSSSVTRQAVASALGLPAELPPLPEVSPVRPTPQGPAGPRVNADVSVVAGL
jgi:hypothetical protein